MKILARLRMVFLPDLNIKIKSNLSQRNRNMTKSHLLLFLLVFCLPFTWCQMRRTIKNLKYPFPVAWTPIAHTTVDVGDREEATACWKYRTFSYNQGFGNTFYLTTQPLLTKDQSEDHFGGALCE